MKVSNKYFKIFNNMFSIILLFCYPLLKIISLTKQIFTKTKTKKILISKLCCFGDSVLSLYSIDKFKELNPNVKITVISTNRTSPLFELSKTIDKVITLPISGTKGLKEFKNIGSILIVYIKVLFSKYDIYYDFDLYYTFTLPFSFLSGANIRKGFDTIKFRTLFFNKLIHRDKNEFEYLSFYKFLDEKMPFSFKPIKIESNKADKNFAKKNMQINNKNSLNIIIVPGGSPNWTQKRWPIKNFIKLLKLINKRYSARFIIVGSKDERILAEKIISKIDSEVINLCGKTSISKLIEVIKYSNLMISNDTGPMHLASACNLKTIGIYGPTNEKKWSSPAKHFKSIKIDIKCRPCFYLSSMEDCSSLSCLQTLTAEKVFTEVKKVL